MIGLVGDVDGAVLRHRDAAGTVKLAGAGAVLAPLAKQSALGGIDRHAVAGLLLAPGGRPEVGQVKVAGTVQRDAAGVGQDGEVSQELTPGIELLDAVVHVIGDERLVRSVDGGGAVEIYLGGIGGSFHAVGYKLW